MEIHRGQASKKGSAVQNMFIMAYFALNVLLERDIPIQLVSFAVTGVAGLTVGAVVAYA